MTDSERAQAIIAIGQVVARYCRGVDRLDEAMVASTYWPDSYDDHGPFKGTGPELAKWAVDFLNEQYSTSSHIVGQSLFEFRGEQAGVETQFTAWNVVRATGRGRIIGGRYADLFERRAGEWKVLHRVVLYDWNMMAEAVPITFPHAPVSRSTEDPSYRIFKD